MRDSYNQPKIIIIIEINAIRVLLFQKKCVNLHFDTRKHTLSGKRNMLNNPLY